MEIKQSKSKSKESNTTSNTISQYHCLEIKINQNTRIIPGNAPHWVGGSAGECGRREPAQAREQAARSAGGCTYASFLFVLCVCNVSCWCPVGPVEERATDPVSGVNVHDMCEFVN